MYCSMWVVQPGKIDKKLIWLNRPKLTTHLVNSGVALNTTSLFLPRRDETLKRAARMNYKFI